MNTITAYRSNLSNSSQGIEDLYYSWLAFIDATPKTIQTYTRAVRQFMRYLSDNGIKAPQKADLIAYKAYLMQAGRKPSTITAYIMAIKQFFKWTEEEGLYPNIAKNVKGAKLTTDHKKDALNKAQVKRLMQSINTDTIQGKRDYAILMLMLTGGLRTIEVIRADVKDIRPAGDNIALYVQGKGRTEKDEPVILPQETQDAIINYLKTREYKEDEPLFTSQAHRNAGERLTTKSISRLVKNHLGDAGLTSDRITAHSLRHTAATEALKAGATLQETQQFMRHTNLNTTMIYVHNLEKQTNPCSGLIASALFK